MACAPRRHTKNNTDTSRARRPKAAITTQENNDSSFSIFCAAHRRNHSALTLKQQTLEEIRRGAAHPQVPTPAVATDLYGTKTTLQQPPATSKQHRGSYPTSALYFIIVFYTLCSPHQAQHIYYLNPHPTTSCAPSLYYNVSQQLPPDTVQLLPSLTTPLLPSINRAGRLQLQDSGRSTPHRHHTSIPSAPQRSKPKRNNHPPISTGISPHHRYDTYLQLPFVQCFTTQNISPTNHTATTHSVDTQYIHIQHTLHREKTYNAQHTTLLTTHRPKSSATALHQQALGRSHTHNASLLSHSLQVGPVPPPSISQNDMNYIRIHTLHSIHNFKYPTHTTTCTIILKLPVTHNQSPVPPRNISPHPQNLRAPQTQQGPGTSIGNTPLLHTPCRNRNIFLAHTVRTHHKVNPTIQSHTNNPLIYFKIARQILDPNTTYTHLQKTTLPIILSLLPAMSKKFVRPLESLPPNTRNLRTLHMHPGPGSMQIVTPPLHGQHRHPSYPTHPKHTPHPSEPTLQSPTNTHLPHPKIVRSPRRINTCEYLQPLTINTTLPLLHATTHPLQKLPEIRPPKPRHLRTSSPQLGPGSTITPTPPLHNLCRSSKDYPAHAQHTYPKLPHTTHPHTSRHLPHSKIARHKIDTQINATNHTQALLLNNLLSKYHITYFHPRPSAYTHSALSILLLLPPLSPTTLSGFTLYKSAIAPVIIVSTLHPIVVHETVTNHRQHGFPTALTHSKAT